VGSPWRLPGLRALYHAEDLQRIVRDMLGGDLTLDSPALHTRLALVLKRLDTGAPWAHHHNRTQGAEPDPSHVPQTPQG